MKAQLLVDCRCYLGEGVQWRAADARLYWTDIEGDALWSCDAQGGAVRRVPLEIGLCAFAFDPTGAALGAFKDGVCRFDPATGAREMLRAYMPATRDSRMNDGNLDRQGRFVVGGINQGPGGAICPVWRVGPDIAEVADPAEIANSICFSPDGAQMYFTDTPSNEIVAYAYDSASGQTSDRRVFARVTSGGPDGSTVDAGGHVWTAIWGGSCVECRDTSGTLVRTIEVPVPHVTCVAFGGADLTRLFITTARQGMEPDGLARHPEAGSVFAVDLETPGLPHGTYTGGFEF